jgi:hypothetical protein
MIRSFQTLFAEMGRDARDRELAATELHPLDPVIERLKLRMSKGDRYMKHLELVEAEAARESRRHRS